MALQLGAWDFNSNGDHHQLTINNVDGNGNLDGTIQGEAAGIVGFWDDVAKKITFVRVINAADPSAQQIYTGYLIETAPPLLTGHFEAFTGTGGSAQRPVYGWTAQKA